MSKISRKELVLIGFVMVIILIIVNILSNIVIIQYIQTSVFSSDYENQRYKYLKSTKNDNWVHPFYGMASGNEIGFESDISSERSFARVSPKPQHGEIKVLVLGGSVAAHLSAKNTLNFPYDFALSRRLNKQFNTERFVVYNAAFGGGKQPQQYFKLLYLDFLGFKPDLIINYDGFNEVALPFGENLEKKLNAVYPRSFDESIFSTMSDKSCIGINNWLLSMNSYIPFIELVKWIYVRSCHNELTGSEKSVRLSNEDAFMIEEKNYLERVRNVWSVSSNKIADFAGKNSIPYIHVVQPNQYLIRSKPLSQAEIDKFYDYEPYKKPIEAYYSSLNLNDLVTSQKLDQRWLFKEERRTVYSDHCCHFNQIGMEMIIEDLIDEFEPIFISLINLD